MYTSNAEKDVLVPAMKSMKAVLNASSSESTVRRVIVTSSFIAVGDVFNPEGSDFTYTAEHWSPITYEDAISGDYMAYCGAKKFSELYAWQYMQENNPHFDLVTIVPPMTLGPIAHPIANLSELNFSNLAIADIASGKDYPLQFSPIWIDVRDVATAHAEALVRPEAGNRRLTICAPEKYTHQLAADIMRQELEWARDVVRKGDEGAPLPPSFSLDGATAEKILGLKYRSFRECIRDFTLQYRELTRNG